MPISLTETITAVGALGTAAYGIVDASKIATWAIPTSGFPFIEELVKRLTDGGEASISNASALTRPAITESLKSNWINGMALPDQKSVAKTLIKLRLNDATASHLAEVTGVDSEVLKSVAVKLSNGEPMTQPEMDTYGRFDVLLSTVIDRAYQRADQKYRTTNKLIAGVVAVILAEVGAYTLNVGGHMDYVRAFVVGLLATPLAPVAKDLSTALTTAVKAVQSARS
jgi:hypothetical protein